MNTEIEKFTSIAEDWWNIDGPFKKLHEINHTRLEYICKQIRRHICKEEIFDVEILDVGCGGGIVSVPLARLGAKVTGVDLGAENIEAAKRYAKSHKLKIDYLNIGINELKKKYDIILCLEVLEHVDNLSEFIADLKKLLKLNGIIIFSTINRTIKGGTLAIIAAEYIFRWVPIGTHSFSKFIKPSELSNLLEENKITLLDVAGMSYNVIDRKWFLSDDIDVNYFLTGVLK